VRNTGINPSFSCSPRPSTSRVISPGRRISRAAVLTPGRCRLCWQVAHTRPNNLGIASKLLTGDQCRSARCAPNRLARRGRRQFTWRVAVSVVKRKRGREFLAESPPGVSDEGDFIFIFFSFFFFFFFFSPGYPGDLPAQHGQLPGLRGRVRMPYVADWYAWQIGLMEKLGAEDRGVALHFHAARIKVANTMKNYGGKLKGMKG